MRMDHCGRVIVGYGPTADLNGPGCAMRGWPPVGKGILIFFTPLVGAAMRPVFVRGTLHDR